MKRNRMQVMYTQHNNTNDRPIRRLINFNSGRLERKTERKELKKEKKYNYSMRF